MNISMRGSTLCGVQTTAKFLQDEYPELDETAALDFAIRIQFNAMLFLKELPKDVVDYRSFFDCFNRDLQKSFLNDRVRMMEEKQKYDAEVKKWTELIISENKKYWEDYDKEHGTRNTFDEYGEKIRLKVCTKYAEAIVRELAKTPTA